MDLGVILFVFACLFLMLAITKRWRVPRERKPPDKWWGKR